MEVIGSKFSAVLRKHTLRDTIRWNAEHKVSLFLCSRWPALFGQTRMEVTVLRKRLCPFVCCLMLCVLLFGCSPIALQNITDLLRAPELGQGQGEIQQALASYLGEQPSLRYPKEGNWQSPLIVGDLDGNGSVESVLLYGLADPVAAGRSNNVYVAVLEQQDGVWQVVQDLEGLGTEVASFEVVDLLQNGKQQLIIGFASASNLNTKTFSLFEYNGNRLEDLVGATPYSRYELIDIDASGQQDLVIVSPNDQIGGLNLQYIPVENEQLNLSLAPVQLDANFSSCDGLYPSSSADGTTMLVVDGLTDTQLLASDLLYFTGEHFYKVNDSGALVGETARTNPLLSSRDIDGDGIVEIPQRVGLSPIETPAADKSLEYVQWVDFTGQEPLVKEFGILDSGKGAYIRLPESWKDNLTVLDGAAPEEWILSDSESGETLLHLQVVGSSEPPPPNSLLVSHVSGTYLIPGASLSSAERNIIRVDSMF